MHILAVALVPGFVSYTSEFCRILVFFPFSSLFQPHNRLERANEGNGKGKDKHEQDLNQCVRQENTAEEGRQKVSGSCIELPTEL